MIGTTYRRHASERIVELLADFPAVVLTGARQVGKSTLAESLVRERHGTYLTLDDMALRTQALADPQGFVAGHRGLVAIDEVQLAPNLLRAIKLEIDRRRHAGRFLLTGSVNLLRMRKVGESLAGRSAWVELAPLTWSEIRGSPWPRTLESAFAARDAAAFVGGLAPAVANQARLARERALMGGMPATLKLSADARYAWYDGYRQTFLERDLRQIAAIENLPEFARLLTLAAQRSAALLNKSALAAQAGLPHPTVRRYLNILEVGYQFYELPPYFSNLGKRLVKTPKLYAMDSGLLAHMTGIDSWEEATARGQTGALLETWAVGELRALNQLSARPSTMCFWRTSGGREVDLVLERSTKLLAVEIKASGTVTYADTLGLREMREALGHRFHLGIVGYLGETAAALDRSLCVIPLGSMLGTGSGKTGAT